MNYFVITYNQRDIVQVIQYFPDRPKQIIHDTSRFNDIRRILVGEDTPNEIIFIANNDVVLSYCTIYNLPFFPTEIKIGKYGDIGLLFQFIKVWAKEERNLRNISINICAGDLNAV